MDMKEAYYVMGQAGWGQKNITSPYFSTPEKRMDWIKMAGLTVYTCYKVKLTDLEFDEKVKE